MCVSLNFKKKDKKSTQLPTLFRRRLYEDKSIFNSAQMYHHDSEKLEYLQLKS